MDLSIGQCKRIRDHIRDGDEIDADLLTGEIKKPTTGATAQYPAVSPQVREMVEEGGMKAVLTKYLHDHPILAQLPEPIAAE